MSEREIENGVKLYENRCRVREYIKDMSGRHIRRIFTAKPFG